MATLALKPVKVAVDGGDEPGVLVFKDEMLVAVLACLTDPMYQDDTGRWFLEAGFGPCSGRQDTFGTIEDALRWVAERSRLDAGQAVAEALAGFHPPSRSSGS